MKRKNVFRVTLLTYLVLTIRGRELKCINNGENSGQILIGQQVNRTIQVEDGDVYDCVDVNLQPTFKHPMLKDHKIQMEPSSFPIGLDIQSPLEVAFSQAQLSTINCPIGTVPILRNNVDTKMVQRIGTLASNDKQQLLRIKYWDEIYGIQASINVYDTKVKKDSKDLSASWIQDNGLKIGHGVGIGAGSCVYPSFSGDSYPRFHISWDPKTKNWWLAYGPTASSYPPQMGSVHFASEGFGKADFIRNIQVIKDENNKLVSPDIHNSHPGSNDLNLYDYGGYGVNDNGGVKICIDRDEIIGSAIPGKDLNMTIQMEPSSYPLDLDIQSILSSNISESHFPDIKCPAGTIPILRHNSSEAHMPNGGSQEEVWPSFSGDNFARFHIRWVDSSNKPCYDFNCPGFVQVSQLAAIGGRITPVSVYNGPQYITTVMLFQTKDWWLARLDKSSAIGYRPLGYWPSKLFDTLQEKATYAFWGGWVRGPTVSSDPPPMGSGHFAKEGYKKAAFVKGIRIANKDNNFVNPNVGKATPVTTRGLCYTVDGFGVLNMGMHLYFGGPGECPK
uniref:Neprosin PEP catalytic domain-containing protein n=1 Tax=Oryza punctata TaxID=4537 RepID=A0A0E0K6A0_ORYPU